MQVAPVTLVGTVVRLEPLQLEHADALFQAGQDPTIWRFLRQNYATSPGDMEGWIASALEEQQAGTSLPFAIIEQATGQIVGSTRYLDISYPNRGLEIGWTWLSPSVQRTRVNTECKYLLLRHAFEQLGAIRVQLKTHHENFRSQRAIERIGATREGVLRNHVILVDGSYRHSVYYSIIESEWPAVKHSLEEKLQQ
ncbi:GNAT family N-acetyltransferase [Tengunoibacter tsumagoiensis]